MQQSIVKFYCLVVQILLHMFRALQCPSSGARQTAVAASGFRMNVEVKMFSVVVGLLVTKLLDPPSKILRTPNFQTSKTTVQFRTLPALPHRCSYL
jgi:hypothetical protein